MTFDFQMIQKTYQALPGRIEAARKILQKPLTLTEKILYGHLFNGTPESPYKRGEDYVDFSARPGSHAGCHRPDGSSAVYAGGKIHGGRPLHRALRPPDPGKIRSPGGSKECINYQ